MIERRPSATVGEWPRGAHRLGIHRQRHGAPAVGKERHARGHAAHVALEQQRSASSGAPSDLDGVLQFSRVAGEAHATATGAARGLDDDRIADLARSRAPVPRSILASTQDARLRVGHAVAGQAPREPRLVGGAADRRRAGTEKRRSPLLRPRRQAFEAAIRLWRHQPHGVGGDDQAVERARFLRRSVTTSTPGGASSGKRGSAVVTI